MGLMTRTFSGSVMLPTAIGVTLDCLGQTIEGVIEDGSFTLTFPRYQHDEMFLHAPEFHAPDWLDEFDGEPRFWGVGNLERGGAVVLGLAIWLDTTILPDRTSDEVTASFVQELFPTAFVQWIGRVSTLLELWAGQGVQLFHGFRSEGPVVQLFDHNTDIGYRPETLETASGRLAATVGPARRLVSLDEWQSAARLVSAGDAPDVVWQMFSRARQLARTEPCFAVIEACTAVEIAIGRRVRETLYGHPEDARDQVVINAGGLYGLFRLYRKLFPGHADWPDVSNALANLRNDVAHAGRQPTESEVETALTAARQTLEVVCPLPAPTTEVVIPPAVG